MNKLVKVALVSLAALIVGAGVAGGYVYLKNRGQLSSHELGKAVNAFFERESFNVSGQYKENTYLRAPATFSADVQGDESQTSVTLPLRFSGKETELSAQLRTVDGRSYIKFADVEKSLGLLGNNPQDRATKNNLLPIVDKYGGTWILLDEEAEANRCAEAIQGLRSEITNVLANQPPEFEKTESGSRYQYELSKGEIPQTTSGCTDVQSVTITFELDENDSVQSMSVESSAFQITVKQSSEGALNIQQPKTTLRFSQLKKELQTLFIQ